ncbi:MAG: gamma-glutamyltransferase, partial [Gemmatimonadota bacterium]
MNSRARPDIHSLVFACVAAAGTLVFGPAACAEPVPQSLEEAGSAVTFPETWRYEAGRAPVVSDRGMVVSTDSFATAAGLEILRAGGNAVDAAIATSFALAVVNPEAGNIGGGGFMIARLADDTRFALDYREEAPTRATADMFLDEQGDLTDRGVRGHLASGVPGTVAGMAAAHERYGT